MNQNYKIKTISIPDRDEDGVKIGTSIILEVVSIEKLKAIVNTPEGGTLTTEGLFFVCYENMFNKPKKLQVISAESDGEIEILKIERYAKSTKFRSDHRGTRRTN